MSKPRGARNVHPGIGFGHGPSVQPGTCGHIPYPDGLVVTAASHIAAVALRGVLAPATGGMVPPGMPGHVPDIALPFDPEAARRLLSEAGYADPNHFPEIDCLHPDYPVIALPRHFITSQWQNNLGLNLKWRKLEWGRFLKRLNDKVPQLWLLGWIADYPDPDCFLRLAIQQHHSGRVWNNDEYADLVERARRVSDHSERMRLYARIQRLLAEEVPVVPLAYSRGHFLIKPWISDYPLSPMRSDYFKDVVIEPHD